MASVKILRKAYRVQTTDDTTTTIFTIPMASNGTSISWFGHGMYRRADTNDAYGRTSRGVAARVSDAAEQSASIIGRTIGTVTGASLSSSSPSTNLVFTVRGEPTATCEHWGFLLLLVRDP